MLSGTDQQLGEVMAISKKINPEEQVAEKAEGIALEQAPKEEGKGRISETIKNERNKPDGSRKTDRAMKIMRDLWNDI